MRSVSLPAKARFNGASPRRSAVMSSRSRIMKLLRPLGNSRQAPMMHPGRSHHAPRDPPPALLEPKDDPFDTVHVLGVGRADIPQLTDIVRSIHRKMPTSCRPLLIKNRLTQKTRLTQEFNRLTWQRNCDVEKHTFPLREPRSIPRHDPGAEQRQVGLPLAGNRESDLVRLPLDDKDDNLPRLRMRAHSPSNRSAKPGTINAFASSRRSWESSVFILRSGQNAFDRMSQTARICPWLTSR